MTDNFNEFIDPLLGAPMVEKEYAFDRFASDGASSESVESTSLGGSESSVGNDVVETPRAQEQSPTEQPNTEPPENQASPSQSSIPNMSFIDDDEGDPNGDSDGQGEGQGQQGADEPNLNVPDAEAEESAEMIADLVLDLYQNQLPELLHKTSKIPVQNIQVAEAIGKVGKGTTELIEDLNKRNKDQLKVPNEHRKMIKKPLIKVLTVRGISVSPEMALIMALLISAMGLFMTWREIKNQNDNLINSILEQAMTK